MNTYFPVSPLLFNGFPFLFLFLPLSLVIFHRLESNKGRLILLLSANYAFYALWDWRFCLLLFFLSLISFLCARFISRLEESKSFLRRAIAFVPVFSVGLTWFFISFYNSALEFLGASFLPATFNLPYLEFITVLGFTSFSLINLGYVLDVYFRKTDAAADFITYACFASLFPCILGGPIIRYGRVKEDLTQLNSKKDESYKRLGWSFFVLGMIQKVLLADTLSVYLTGPLKNPGDLPVIWAWLSMLVFLYRTYFDLCGYFNMATGLAYLFGIKLPENFNSPLRAATIKEFFQRWNITLHDFWRDFIYIPLGGNRISEALTARNIIVTVLLGGLWQTGRITGLLCFLIVSSVLVIQNRFDKETVQRWAPAFQISTFLTLIAAAVLYRFASLYNAGKTFEAMFGLSGNAEPNIPGVLLLAIILLIAVCLSHFAPNSFQLSHQWKPPQAVTLSLLFLFCLFLIAGGHQSQFVFM